MPVKRFSNVQVITAPFGEKRGNRTHKGVDLRSRRFLPETGYVKQWGLQDVVATERCRIKRFGTDQKGNDYIVLTPMKNTDYYELKYIHVTLRDEVKVIDKTLEAGDRIGKTQIKGTSKAHHLHFEVWDNLVAIDPLIYFNDLKIKYKFKKAPKIKYKFKRAA